jgi:hypothetical protein
MVLAMAVTILAITTWAAPPNPESDSAMLLFPREMFTGLNTGICTKGYTSFRDRGAKGEFEWCPTLAVAMPDEIFWPGQSHRDHVMRVAEQAQAGAKTKAESSKNSTARDGGPDRF